MAVVPNVDVLVVPSVPMPEACVPPTPLEPELIMPVEVPVVGVLENSGALVIPEETELTGEVLEAPEVSVLVLVVLITDPL